jgi:hypothetical protein
MQNRGFLRLMQQVIIPFCVVNDEEANDESTQYS